MADTAEFDTKRLDLDSMAKLWAGPWNSEVTCLAVADIYKLIARCRMLEEQLEADGKNCATYHVDESIYDTDLAAANKRIEELEGFRAAVVEASTLPRLSPSAAYDMQRVAVERGKRDYQFGGIQPDGLPWWEVYPEGHLTALAFRVWRLTGATFIVPKELP